MQGADELIVTNPATGVELARVPNQTEAEVDAAVARARAAQPAWGALPFAERRRLLRGFARTLRDDPELPRILVAETGQSHFDAEAMEVLYLLDLVRFMTSGTARRALAEQRRTPFLFRNKAARVIREPRGVVGVIGPWNWPLLNNFADAIPALAAGNACVLKPSEWTPLTSLHIAKLWKSHGMPEGVFEVITGTGAAGAALVERADMIFFTGSQRVGRVIAARCGERLIPVVVELGGNSPAIVLADADLERAAATTAWSAFFHGGHGCVRTERVIVERAVAARFTELFVARVRALRQGVPVAGEASPDLGAVTFAPQVEVAQRHVADAVAKGATILTGGKLRTDLPGLFFEPTVLGGVTPGMDVAEEESFAPVVPILQVGDADEAVALANATRFGLSGSVWSRDRARALEIARRVESGSLCINDAVVNYDITEAPLGGHKASGLGVRHGTEALLQFCRVKTVIEDAPLLGVVSPWLGRLLYAPYKERALRLLRRLMRIAY